jgi:general secretion pathway protein A
VEELLREVLLDFGVVSRQGVRNGRISSASKHELISTLHDFLLSLMAIRGSAVLIIDEAQHLSPQVLEQIRIISNLETNESKLLQIVLVGQLNLLDVLAAAEMRQLDQRISIRAALKPLTRDEVEAYIAHRLWVARGSAAVTFEAVALDRVHSYTGGVPRIINLLCDRSLMQSAQMRVNRVTAAIIDEAAASLGLRLAATRGKGSIAPVRIVPLEERRNRGGSRRADPHGRRMVRATRSIDSRRRPGSAGAATVPIAVFVRSQANPQADLLLPPAPTPPPVPPDDAPSSLRFR